jgi:hypothetical protein
MPSECYPELVSSDVENQALFGTDFPIQGGFYSWTGNDVGVVLEHFYRKELDVVKAAGYSEDVMSRNFKRFLCGGDGQ